MSDADKTPSEMMGRRLKQVFVVFILITGFFLIAEHRAHVIPYLPWLLLAACPLMHMFMHRGHGRHHGDSTRESSPPHGGDRG